MMRTRERARAGPWPALLGRLAAEVGCPLTSNECGLNKSGKDVGLLGRSQSCGGQVLGGQ